MTGQSPGRGFFTVHIFKGGAIAALGRKRRRFQRRALGLLSALVLGLGVILPALLALGVSPADAASCGSSNPCAPTGVTFEQPGASILDTVQTSPFLISVPVPLSDIQVCGIEGSYAPLASSEIDQNFDDPQGINSAGSTGFGGPGDAGGTTEGNYPDSQLVAFQPATSLGPNDKITVGLPHPAEPYPNSGAILPPAQVSLDTLEPVEQASSTVTGPATAALNTTVTVTVTLQSGQGNVLSGRTVRLDALNPYAPPLLGKSAGQNVIGDTHASIQNSTATTDNNGVATFQVSDNTNEDVVFAATDVSNSNLRISQTGTVSFGTGGDGSSTQVCSGSQLSAPSAAAADNGFPYLLVESTGNSNDPYAGYLVPSVAVSSESGNETATLTIPADVPAVSAGQTAYLLALDATSPPGPATAYAPDAFSVSTSEDPVPGYPSAAPTLQATYPVSGSASTLTSSAPSAQVSTGSLSATATLLDQYNNPISGKQVSIFQTSGTHANVSPSTAPSGGNEYPVSGNDGTVGYTVSDSCAETVNLEATDVTDNQPVTSGSGLAQLPVTFTAGPPVAPDVNLTSTGCGGSPTQSSVMVSAPGISPVSGSAVNAPADGTTQATVQVTLGDQFGNADVCQHVVLSPTTKASNATITPQPPPPADQAQASKSCPNPGGAGYTGTDGVATFKVTDSTVQDVIFNVTDATLPAVWPSTPAEDVAEVNFEGADAGQSTVTATSPSSSSPCTTTYNNQTFTTGACAPADGQPAATVTVTVKDGAGQLMQNQKVTLAGCTSASSPCTPDSTTTITPSTQTTDNHGQAAFNVAGSSAHRTVYYQATDVSGSVPITSVASVWFTAGGVSLSASPASVVADGTGTSTVTFTLKDTTGAAVQGVPVCLTAPTAAHASISPAPVLTTSGSPPCSGSSPVASTDSTGQVTFTVTDKNAESVPFTATATYTPSQSTHCLGLLSNGTCTVTATVTVRFVTAPVSFSINAVPATDVLADGLSSSQVTVTAYDGSDPSTSNPVAGVPVSLSASLCQAPSPTATVSITPAAGQLTNTYGQGVTNSSGQATFTVTDTAAETVTLGGCYQEIDQQPSASLTSLPGSATVTFAETEAQASTVVASPASAPADGTSTVKVTVVLKNGTSNPAINGHSVVLTTSSATTTVVPSNVGGITGVQGQPAGQVTFTITDTRPEQNVMVYARDQNTGVILNDMPTISFTQTEAQNSTVTASPASVAAGGPLGAPRTSTVTVTLAAPIPSTCPQALSGHTVKLSSGSGTANITPLSSGPGLPAGVTNSSGQAEFAVSDPAVENVTFTAVDTSCNNLALTHTATVNFAASEANQSTVTISPVSTPADGPAATLTVTLRHPDGTPISGSTVTVPAVLHATVTPLAYPGLNPGVTNAYGQAQFAVSDTAVEMVPLVAYDGTTQIDQGATVNFTANEANQSTMSATVTSPPALGGSTTVTVTLVSGGGAPIAGHNVSLSGNSSTVSITPASATTNGAGQATFTVRDPNAESVVLTALDTTSGAVVVQTLPLTFIANEQNQSTATASPTIVQTKKTSTITVTLLGANDQPLAGHHVALNTGSTTSKVTVLTSGGVTNANGQIQFSVTDTAAETLSITVTDTTTNVTLYRTVTVTFNKP